MGLGFLLIGPSYIWNIHENIWVMLTGISILGFSASFAILPLMPMIMDEIKAKFHDRQKNYIDTASSLYNSAFGFGSILGPMLGAHLNSYFGFRICTDILSHFSGLLFLVLLVSAYYFKLFRFIKNRMSEQRVILREQIPDRSSLGSINNDSNQVECDVHKVKKVEAV
jgi:MFS family permease